MRFVEDYYSDFHASTIGVDFKTVITMVKGKLVKLQLWDTAGQERFSVVTGNYYRNSDGFVFFMMPPIELRSITLSNGLVRCNNIMSVGHPRLRSSLGTKAICLVNCKLLRLKDA